MNILQNSLVRQFLGAAVGTVVALLLYMAYEAVSPHLQASLFLQTPVPGYTDEQRHDRQDQVVLQARQLLSGQDAN